MSGLTHDLARAHCDFLDAKVYIDGKNISWKMINGGWIGKRSVWTKDNRACWLEDTIPDNVKSYWCGGKDADYSEIFLK